MGSGIVFSVGGFSSEQDLQRLRRAEEMGGDKGREGRQDQTTSISVTLTYFSTFLYSVSLFRCLGVEGQSSFVCPMDFTSPAVQWESVRDMFCTTCDRKTDEVVNPSGQCF